MEKLSTYIRQGAEKHPQAFGDYIQQVPLANGWQYEYRTCALGAVYESITGKIPEPDWLQNGRVNKVIFNATDIKNVRLPYPENTLNGCKAYAIDMVSTLNDTFKWTREQIADYLESQGY